MSKQLHLWLQEITLMLNSASRNFCCSIPTTRERTSTWPSFFRGRDDLQAAENSLTDALIIDPEHAAALNQLGMLLRRQGKFQEAEAAYLKAVTASPDYALAHYNLGVLNDLYLRQLEDALLHYERYLELVDEEDKQVTRWIADLKRRITATQRTANVTE